MIQPLARRLFPNARLAVHTVLVLDPHSTPINAHYYLMGYDGSFDPIRLALCQSDRWDSVTDLDQILTSLHLGLKILHQNHA